MNIKQIEVVAKEATEQINDCNVNVANMRTEDGQSYYEAWVYLLEAGRKALIREYMISKDKKYVKTKRGVAVQEIIGKVKNLIHDFQDIRDFATETDDFVMTPYLANRAFSDLDEIETVLNDLEGVLQDILDFNERGVKGKR